MPEGDSLHRAARQLQVLVGERLEVQAPHRRAAAERIAERLDGLVLTGVEARGKNLLLSFENGAILRSHLRMSGRWRVQPRGAPVVGRPWLVLRGSEREAILRGGPVLELHTRGLRTLGPDILAESPDLERMLSNLRRHDQNRALGDALLDQRLVSGIGNFWKAEALWRAQVSPWASLGRMDDAALSRVLETAAGLMRASVENGRAEPAVYRRTGHACHRCGTPISSRGQGDANRIAYWCPSCQRGEPAPGA